MKNHGEEFFAVAHPIELVFRAGIGGLFVYNRRQFVF